MSNMFLKQVMKWLAIITSVSAPLWAQSYGKQVAVASNADGRLEFFYIGLDDGLYHDWQVARNGDFAMHRPLSGPCVRLLFAQHVSLIQCAMAW